MKRLLVLLGLITSTIAYAGPSYAPTSNGEYGWGDGRRFVGVMPEAIWTDPTTFWLTQPEVATFNVDREGREIVFLTNGTFSVTTDAAATLGDGFSFVVKNVGTGTITIDPNGLETIDGALTFTLSNQYDGVQIVTDGVAWYIAQFFIGGTTGNLWKRVGTDLSPVTDGDTVTINDSTAAGSTTFSTDINGDLYVRNTGLRSCIGRDCMLNDTTLYGTCMGDRCFQDNIGNFSTAMGFASARFNSGIGAATYGYISGDYNRGGYVTFSGYSSGRLNIGDSSTGVGANSLELNEGMGNSALGRNAFDTFAQDTGNQVNFSNTDINVGLNRITIAGHGFTGYVNLEYIQGTSSVPGLVNGAEYQFEVIDASTLELKSGIMTAAGTGTGHTLIPQFIYINSTAIGYDAEPDASNQVMLGDTNVTEVKTSGGYTSAGNTIRAPSTLVVVAGTGIATLGFTNIDVSGSIAGDNDITATPNIAAGINGQIIEIMGTSDTNRVTFQDEGNLPGSGLKLGNGVNITLGEGDILGIRYSSTVGTWVERYRSDN